MKKVFASLLLACMTTMTTPSVTLSRPVDEITFTTADNGSVSATLYGTGEQGVVLAHGAVFNKKSWDSFARTLATEGFRILALDFRGYGKSKAGSKPDALYEDILAAVRYLHGTGAEPISVIGASMGGGATAQAAVYSETGEIAKVVLLSAVPIPSPERMKGEILFIASANEPILAKINAQYAEAPEPKRLVLLEGKAHAQHIFKTDQTNALTKTIIEFLKN